MICLGFGFGIAYIPGVAMVDFYFEKHRSLAMGIAVSGCGIGTFIFPPMIAYLIRTYSLDGALLLVGGGFEISLAEMLVWHIKAVA